MSVTFEWRPGHYGESGRISTCKVGRFSLWAGQSGTWAVYPDGGGEALDCGWDEADLEAAQVAAEKALRSIYESLRAVFGGAT